MAIKYIYVYMRAATMSFNFTWMTVDLPEPEGPTSAIFSPFLMDNCSRFRIFSLCLKPSEYLNSF